VGVAVVVGLRGLRVSASDHLPSALEAVRIRLRVSGVPALLSSKAKGPLPEQALRIALTRRLAV
jgi:hypothetical protein